MKIVGSGDWSVEMLTEKSCDDMSEDIVLISSRECAAEALSSLGIPSV